MKVVCSMYAGLILPETGVRMASGGGTPEGTGLNRGGGEWGPAGEMGQASKGECCSTRSGTHGQHWPKLWKVINERLGILFC